VQQQMQDGTKKSSTLPGHKNVSQRVHWPQAIRVEMFLLQTDVYTRVARWYIFKTKNPELGIFGYILEWKM
jgi:hypothetical protein